MIDITVTVSGPGGVINNEMLVIEQALKNLKYTVIVENDRDVKTKPDPWREGEGITIKLKADHQPWGG